MTRFFIRIAALLVLATPVYANIISAENAAQEAQAGTLTLIDIRTPAEWAATGVPANALTMDAYSRDFGPKLIAQLGSPPGKKVALICAVGGRSGHIIRALKAMGYQQVLDVSEGMMGSAQGSGWLAKALPVVTYQQ